MGRPHMRSSHALNQGIFDSVLKIQTEETGHGFMREINNSTNIDGRSNGSK